MVVMLIRVVIVVGCLLDIHIVGEYVPSSIRCLFAVVYVISLLGGWLVSLCGSFEVAQSRKDQILFSIS